ncbi:MAG: ribonuclease J [Deltaproteobacteria bacterium]|nr:ribonuclease J [Deltaproteobacteria bacterium]
MTDVRIIPLGGVREFGLNSTVIETSQGAILVDAGQMFPKYTTMGIDHIIPDFTYVIENQEIFEGIILTHGHEDHIGALPYLLKEAPIPVYGHTFTIEMVKRKLLEYEIDDRVTFHSVKCGQRVSVAGLVIDFIDVEHSTIGCFALSLHTPQGIIVHSGDFRKAPEEYKDIPSPIRLFMCESTNAASEPRCVEEAKALQNIENIVRQTPGMVIVSTFASHVSRINALVEVAAKNNRRAAIVGRSMNQIIDIATSTGYVNLDKKNLLDPEIITSTKKNKVMIICTGTQGEIYSMLSLIARGWHKIKVGPGDSVIISARMIPGNEMAIGRCIDQLLEFGAKVSYSEIAEIHATGHATHDEIKKALHLLKPEFVMPIHGEFRQMKALADMIPSIPEISPHIVLPRPGQVWTLSAEGMHITGDVPHGKCFVDGELTGDIKDIVLRDRKHISEGGLVVAFVALDGNSSGIISGPDVMCKGVVPAYMEQEIMDGVKQKALEVLETSHDIDTDIQSLQAYVKKELGRYLKSRLGKKPMVIPIIMEI